jgi:hypothetical protein
MDGFHKPHRFPPIWYSALRSAVVEAGDKMRALGGGVILD